MIVAERREFDIDLPDNADLDARHGGALDLGEIRKDLLVILLGVGEGFRLQQRDNAPCPAVEHLLGAALDELCAAALVVKAHEHVAVHHAVKRLDDLRHGNRPAVAGILFQTHEIERDHRHLREGILECLAQQVNIIRCSASAAGLRQHERDLVDVVLAAFQRGHELSDAQERRITGIVMHIFQTLIHDLACLIGEHLAVIAVLLKDTCEDGEVDRQHHRNQDRMRFFHLRSKQRIAVLTQFDFHNAPPFRIVILYII